MPSCFIFICVTAKGSLGGSDARPTGDQVVCLIPARSDNSLSWRLILSWKEAMETGLRVNAGKTRL